MVSSGKRFRSLGHSISQCRGMVSVSKTRIQLSATLYMMLPSRRSACDRTVVRERERDRSELRSFEI